MNPWQWRDRNPYEETAFQILDVDPTADRAAIRTRIAARRKRISYDAARFPLFGRVLDVARINAAEEELAAPATRVFAELLTHRVESGDTDPADVLALSELAEALGADDPDTGEDDELAIDYARLPTLLPTPAWQTREHLDEETIE